MEAVHPLKVTRLRIPATTTTTNGIKAPPDDDDKQTTISWHVNKSPKGNTHRYTHHTHSHTQIRSTHKEVEQLCTLASRAGTQTHTHIHTYTHT